MFVYWIRHKTNPSLIYIGSTDNFVKRVREHKTDCYNKNCREYNHKKYKIIRANGGFDAFYFQIIDVVISADKSVLLQFEQYYIDHFKSVESMNDRNAVHDSKECRRLYYEDHRAEILAKQALYREENRAEINAKQLRNIEANRAEIYAKHLLYREANRDLINAKTRAKYAFKMEAKRLLSIDI